jgi:hypothetical protein
MGRGVIGHDRAASRGVDLRDEFVADRDGASLDLADVRERGAALLRVDDEEVGRGARQLARVADLAAGLGVERRAVEHDLALVAGAQRVDRLAALEQRDDRAEVADLAVAEEVGLAVDLHAGGQVDAELARRLRLLALLLHRALETVHVDLETAFARDVGRQVGGEAVGVV